MCSVVSPTRQSVLLSGEQSWTTLHVPLATFYRPREDEGVAISRICFKGILVEKQVGRIEKMGESFKIFVLFGFSTPASADKVRTNEHKWVPPSHRSRFSRRKISLLDICKKILRRFFFRLLIWCSCNRSYYVRPHPEQLADNFEQPEGSFAIISERDFSSATVGIVIK